VFGESPYLFYIVSNDFIFIDYYMTKLTELYPLVQVGATVRVYEKITEINAKGEEKSRIQIYEGIVISRRHGAESGASIMVRKVTKEGYGVEKIYPLHAPVIEKIEVVKQAKVRRAKLYFLREKKHKFKETVVAKS
jgi:large subunit ribosomal protein L19